MICIWIKNTLNMQRYTNGNYFDWHHYKKINYNFFDPSIYNIFPNSISVCMKNKIKLQL